MSTEIIEQELATLKQRVEKLEATVDHKPQDAWKKIVGAAKDDDLFEEAMKLGAEWRAKANEEGRYYSGNRIDGTLLPNPNLTLNRFDGRDYD